MIMNDMVNVLWTSMVKLGHKYEWVRKNAWYMIPELHGALKLHAGFKLLALIVEFECDQM